MSLADPSFGNPSGGRASFALAIRYALRELRGGVRGFYVFLTCIMLGVLAIAGVNSFSRSLMDGLSREGRVILGGDISYALIHREAQADERAFLSSQGDVSTIATMRAMARTSDGRTALVELKAADRMYPLYGTVTFDPDLSLASVIGTRDGIFGAAADPALLARLDLQTGSRITIGAATIEIRAILTQEPDKLAGGIGFGPRLLIGEEALRATGLLQPGSLVRWHYLVRKLPAGGVSDAALESAIADTRARFPNAGWNIRSRVNASPQLERNVERFTQFLTIVGLTALLVGGVGVANAVKSHLDRKRNAIAAMKALGATGARIFTIYLTQILLLALAGAALGLAIGAALPFVIAWSFDAALPLPVEPALHPGELALALLYGLLTALAFALWPLGRAHDIPVSALFRDEVAEDARRPPKAYMAATAAVGAALAGVSILLAYDQKIAIIFVASAAAIFLMLRLIAGLLMWLAGKMPRARATVVRMAVANIHRPGALTPTVVMSLGLGLAVLVTVIQIDGNIRRQFLAALPDRAPAFFFVDIQSADAGRFDAFVKEHAPGAELERVPMLRGRIVAANGVRAEDIKATPNAAWVLQSDRGITYATDVPAGSRVVEGQWWPPNYSGPPLISFEKKLADGLGLTIGDMVTVNVLGRNITAKISNLRNVDWQSLGINFVMVYSPGVFSGAPHTHIATLTYPQGSTVREETELLKAVANAFPNVTTVRVKDALDTIGSVVTNLVLAVRGASVITLLAAMLVLGGALAASHRNRVYDAVVLKTLGATRGKLIAAYGLEYLLLGMATAVFGVAAGSLAAWLVVQGVMNLTFTWLPGSALLAAAGALAITLAFGLFGTFKALGQKPAGVLRNL